MVKSAAKRERERLKKERQRERRRHAAIASAILEAERIEREAERQEVIDEQLAPMVMRQSIEAAPSRFVHRMSDVMLMGPRVQIIEGRASRQIRPMVDPINALDLSSRQWRAAQMLQADWRDVGCGIGVGALDYLRAGGGSGDGLGGHKAMLEQIATRARLDGAVTHLGAFAPSVARVVLDGVPVTVWANEVGKTFEDARGWIVAALERLGSFYWPPKPESGEHRPLLTFGPGRESYGLEGEE